MVINLGSTPQPEAKLKKEKKRHSPASLPWKVAALKWKLRPLRSEKAIIMELIIIIIIIIIVIIIIIMELIIY